MDIQTSNQATDSSSQASKQQQAPANDVSNFNSKMKNDTGTDSANPSEGGGQNALDDPQTKELLTKVLSLVQQLLEKMKDNTKGGTTAGANGGVNPVESQSPGGSSGSGSSSSGGSGGSGGAGKSDGASGSEKKGGSSDDRIPPPSENIQQLNLGGKQVTVGGDGTGSASAQEVGDTAKSIEHMYQNSPTFKNMIDNSPDSSFEVSVGKRGDNTSWGRSDGSIFMNTNNISPSNKDSWQSLISHEFAHASIDLGHGGEMEQLEKKAASEA